MNAATVNSFLEAILGRAMRWATNGRSGQGSPSRFDKEFPLYVQARAVRRAEEKRERRRLRNLRALRAGGFHSA